MKLLLLAAAFFITQSAFALDIVENFSTMTHFSSTSTAVWNAGLGLGHVPFVVNQSEGLGNVAPVVGQEDEPINLGDGSDGIFDSTTYATWDTNHGQTATLITLDTSRTYQFISFTLNSGITLTGSGTSPLSIKVQGNMVVNGTIDVSGKTGGSSAASGSTAGGTACCGGLAGGAGGSIAAGSNGGSIDTGSGGGGGGAGAGSGGGGGGGGGQSAGGNAGAAGVGAAGAAGAQLGGSYTNLINPPYGGSGAGGGGKDTTGGGSGAGGGGGGGAMALRVGGDLTIGSAGALLANGGTGGSLGAGNGGCGGGGTGGSQLMLVGGFIYDGGSILANHGTGGTGCTAVGGNGADGMQRWVTFFGDLSLVGNESPNPLVSPLGQTYYSIVPSYQLVSTGYDTGIQSPIYLAATTVETLNGGTITYQFAGSSDNFVSDTTALVSAAQITQLNGKRYFRWQATMTGTNVSAGPSITSVTVQVQQQQFSFQLAGCARAAPGRTPPGPWPALAFLVYLLTLPKWLRLKKARITTERR